MSDRPLLCSKHGIVADDHLSVCGAMMRRIEVPGTPKSIVADFEWLMSENFAEARGGCADPVAYRKRYIKFLADLRAHPATVPAIPPDVIERLRSALAAYPKRLAVPIDVADVRAILDAVGHADSDSVT